VERKWPVPIYELSKNVLNDTIDIMLISKTHFTKKHYFIIPFYSMCHITHLDGIAHDSTIIIIKNNIQHHELDNFKSDFL